MRIFNTRVYGLEESIVRSGYPMSVSIRTDMDKYIGVDGIDNDWRRAIKLGRTQIGSGHDNFLSGIIVQADIEAPSYWWNQWQRYHFQQIVSSQSKMHRITQMNLADACTIYTDRRIIDIAKEYIVKYENGEITIDHLLSNIPQGLQLIAGISTNYLQIKIMVAQRSNHRLEMWNKIFVRWVTQLPEAIGLGIIK